jgi:hypothetical protein
MSRSTNTNYFRMPTDAELGKFASKLDYDNGYDAMVESQAIKNHARTIIFAHIYGIDEVYPLTGEPLKTKHRVEYEEERITKYNGRIGKYTTLRPFHVLSMKMVGVLVFLTNKASISKSISISN